jgi:hypothetical protein
VSVLQKIKRAFAVRSTQSADESTVSGTAEQPDAGFVACIEDGALEAQALLLFDSIRRYAGRFRNCSLYALSPRVGHPISRSARRRLDDLGVKYIEKILNKDCTEYGSANRVAAAAYIEETYPHEILVILDSDTLFLNEPSEFLFESDIDVAVRPVDVKGLSTAGSDDAFDAYWRALCHSSGVDYKQIPWRESFVDHERIKANYNGGLVVVRGGLGIMRRWAEFFFASVGRGLRPNPDGLTFRAGAGWVDSAAGRLWGSNQAALSVAIWSSTQRVRELPPTYNYPLHLHEQIDSALAKQAFPRLVHVHYHWLLEKDSLAANPLFGPASPLSTRQREWLLSATPLR